ncbi:DNA-binding transcriptional activator of the SARP family [Lentzea xinjiangensis]|uniref:DNA-binding transcriptional activator of the SARP family n=1 Tax=Lentzea xinjiangensis TaxID=402600 RepID=A0A1H9LA79_9PSEU|nr:BTAD domain-containing putative transcriptional regulator [Lentzea xinjiangensis]SER08218.1 DNA-binding transcriptional activator of the SARP family [Lentzea xinjiangensis]
MSSYATRRGIVRLLGNLVCALVASAVLLAVLIGLPLGLSHYVGWPLPDEVPSWAMLSAVLTQPMSPSFLIDGLACLCWLLWAAFVLDIGLCAADVLHGVRWPDLAAVRSPAAVLIGTIVLSVLGNRAAGAAGDGLQLASSSPVAVVETVRAPDPVTGTCDSMWAVAERALGDGARWPEIFELNRGKPQPDGLPLTDPHRVFPGENLLVPSAQAPPSTPPVEPATPPPPAPSPEMAQHEKQLPQPDSAPTGRTTAFVSTALAAAVSAALVVARRRYRGRYKPGSGLRDDLPVAPVVYELQLARDRSEHQATSDDDATPLGVRNGQEVALDLAACGGLGLVGPGAVAAARALVLTALTRTTVAITAEDLASLLGEAAVGEPPSALRIVSSRRQLEVTLAQASSRQLSGVFLGQWTHGITLYIGVDGTVSSASPGPGQELTGVKLFHLGDDDAHDLLGLFREAEQRPQPAAAETALEISANVVPADRPPLQLRLLGTPALRWPDAEHDVTATIQPRLRELVVFLAVHPQGTTREALVNALWPANTSDKANNALNTALSRLRNAIAKATGGTITDIAIVGGGRYRLNPDLVEVDYWHLDRAITARRSASTAQERTEAYRQVVSLYTGPLAEGVESEWLEPLREAVRRDVIDAAAALAHALRDVDPEQTLELLELARAFDPHNELLYRDIMRLQGRLGRLEAIPRTLALLTSKLAEIDDKPSPEATWLAANLPRHHAKDQLPAS